MSRQHREPGPDHPITIEAVARPVSVIADGATIVDAISYLSLQEASYPAAAYLPRSAADMNRLERSETTTWCPYKGEAAYFHIRKDDGSLIRDAFWTYEAPFPAVASIKDHLAAYPDRVDAIKIGDAGTD